MLLIVRVETGTGECEKRDDPLRYDVEYLVEGRKSGGDRDVSRLLEAMKQGDGGRRDQQKTVSRRKEGMKQVAPPFLVSAMRRRSREGKEK